MLQSLSRSTQTVFAAIILPLCYASSHGVEVPLKEAPRLNPAAAEYHLGGPIRAQIDGVIENWLLSAPDKNPAILEMFGDRDKKPYRNLLPWSGEFAGKYLTACTQMIRLTGDSALREKVRGFVARLVELQDADGYLGAFPKGDRLTGKGPGLDATWDGWNHYHIMLGLMLWNDLTADGKALKAAEKIGDLLCDRFLVPGKHVADMGSPDQNQAVIHGLALLYRKTGTPRYLKLAEQIVREFERPGAGDYLRTALAGQEFYATPKPRWESLHAILGLIELHRLTGNADYRRAFEHMWWGIVKLDRHNNGGFSSGEQAVGNPYHTGAIETCCTIAWLAMSQEMLRTTGNSIVADEMELSTLNSVVGLHSADGSWCTYNTPMDGKRIPSTTDIAFQIRPGSEQLNCCSVNAARGFAMLSEWAVMTESSAALVVNWYGESTVSTTVGGGKVTLAQATNYPREEHVNLTVRPEKPARFTLKLRIPHWSTNTSVKVNGETVAATAGSYCAIDREWNAGDRVAIAFDFGIRAWVGEKEAAGKVSFYRGPLMLVHEFPKTPERDRPGVWKRFGSLFAANEKGSAFEHDFEGTGIQWFGRLFDDAGIARVTIDGKEVALVDQFAPTRDKAFSWTHEGLIPGKHTIRIEVSGEKKSESKGTWSNVAGFGLVGALKPDDGLELEPLALSAATVKPLRIEGAAVGLEVQSGDVKVALKDFGSAGRNGERYVSWLPATGVTSAEFTRENPLRARKLFAVISKADPK